MRDNVGGRQARGEYLLGLGHRHIAHLTGPRQHGNMADRARGFLAVIAGTRRREWPVLLQRGNQLRRRLRTHAGNCSNAHPDITAVFAANDVMAFGAARAIWEAGKRIPEDSL